MKITQNNKILMHCLLTTMLATGLNQSSALAAKNKGHVKNQNRGAANSHKPEMVDVIISYRDMPSAANNANLKGLGGQIKRSFKNLPMQSISIPSTALEALRHSKGVEFVAQDGQITGQSQSAKKTAKMPNKGSTDYVVPSSTVGVAVLDSGVSYHNELNVMNQVNCVDNTAACSDYSYSNGTTGQTYLDSFTGSNYANSNSADAWSGPWVEVNDDGNATSYDGNVLLHAGWLYMDNWWGGSLASIYRQADKRTAL